MLIVIGVQATEVERKFIVTRLPRGLDRFKHYEIIQAYLKVTDMDEVRVRMSGSGECTITRKQGSGLSRKEDITRIDAGQLERLMQKAIGTTIEKTRYEIPYGGRTIELDVYKGALSGLVVAEVEFNSVGDSSKFRKPAWFGAEVTSDERYKNKNLAMAGMPG